VNIHLHFPVCLGAHAVHRRERTMRNEINFIRQRQRTIGRIAAIIERIGLAMAGALCGLFVAAYTLDASIGVLGTPVMILAMSLIGMAGFYLGIDIPAVRLRAGPAGWRRASPAELPGASGTFLTAVAALASVIGIIFGEAPGMVTAVAIGGAWLCGAILQIGAGALARLGAGNLPVR
jgi:hypothetical protein